MISTRTISFDEAAGALLNAPFQYAKTMPEFPHHYTLRKKWASEQDFWDVVQFIRDNGYREKWGGRWYTYLDINGQRYWTMGAGLQATILINRAEIEREAPYDAVADQYDHLFDDPASREENGQVAAMIGYGGGSVLDVGAGTGLTIELLRPTTYLGIDPSRRMLERLEQRHPGAEVVPTTLQSFWTDRRFDLVVSLFGSPNYCTEEELRRIPDLVAPGGGYFLMFYRPDYHPVTCERAHVELEHVVHPATVLPGKVIEFGNFFILKRSGA